MCDIIHALHNNDICMYKVDSRDLGEVMEPDTNIWAMCTLHIGNSEAKSLEC